jgi:deaminated glutathione amidase
MKVASIQMVSGIDLDANLRQADKLLQQAQEAGAELAVLPEYFCTMGRRDTDKLALAETFGNGPVQTFLSEAAKRWGLWLVGGTLPMATTDPAHVANACLVYDPHGACVARYDKIHLFRFDNGRESYDEAAVLTPGTEPTAFVLKDRTGIEWTVGLSVCYDLRFPELYRRLEADIILVPAAFTDTTGKAHWELLLRARAIENQAFVVASAQGGVHENGRKTWGQSMVVDPWGAVLAQQAKDPGVVVADIDAAYLAQVRQQLPALQHRQF